MFGTKYLCNKDVGDNFELMVTFTPTSSDIKISEMSPRKNSVSIILKLSPTALTPLDLIVDVDIERSEKHNDSPTLPCFQVFQFGNRMPPIGYHILKFSQNNFSE